MRHLAVLAVVALAATLFPLAGSSDAFHQPGLPNDVAVDRMRIEGSDRHGTARDVARKTFRSSRTVVVARGDDYPDSLAGNYLAGVLDVPLLLTPRDALHPETVAALRDLEAENAYIIGGEGAVSAAVERDLAARGVRVLARFDGRDRWETAAIIALTAAGQEGENVGEWDGQRTAIVASGQQFPDALVSGGLSYSAGFPLVLTPSDGLVPDTVAVLDELAIEKVVIPGGTGAVSAAVQGQIEAMGIEVRRVFGRNRVATAVAFADFVAEEFDWTFQHVNLARGDRFPDALTVGPHFGGEEHPLLLTHDPEQIGTNDDPPEGGAVRQETRPWLQEHACDVSSIHIVGGNAAVSLLLEAQARSVASDCPTQLSLDPETGTNAAGAPHPLTATVTSGRDDPPASPVANAEVRFEVYRDGATSPVQVAHATTGQDGSATFGYSATAAAQDVILACTILLAEDVTADTTHRFCAATDAGGAVVTDDDGVLPRGDRPAGRALKTWTDGAP